MARAITGVVAGVVVWIVIATIGNLAMRTAWAGYAEVEAAMKFTSEMMMSRLLVGALSSLGAGWLTARITNHNRGAIYALVALLVVTFVPVHYALWEQFPIWYHVVFFASLAVMTVLGARLDGRKVRDRIVAG
jgi:VIT1/CCC1 family predicted Fe2+/Mn2+ transporter